MTTIELFNLIVSSLSTILAAIAILLYIILWYRDKTSNSYDVFDSIYLEILKMAIENPQFRNPKATIDYENSFSEEEKIKYETYAFICWNFCETIFDKKDDDLMKTWTIVISIENQLHRKWFDNQENIGKFKKSFSEYVSKTYPQN